MSLEDSEKKKSYSNVAPHSTKKGIEVKVISPIILPKKKPDNGPPNIYKDVKKLYKKIFGTKRGNPNKAFRNKKYKG